MWSDVDQSRRRMGFFTQLCLILCGIIWKSSAQIFPPFFTQGFGLPQSTLMGAPNAFPNNFGTSFSDAGYGPITVLQSQYSSNRERNQQPPSYTTPYYQKPQYNRINSGALLPDASTFDKLPEPPFVANVLGLETLLQRFKRQTSEADGAAVYLEPTPELNPFLDDPQPYTGVLPLSAPYGYISADEVEDYRAGRVIRIRPARARPIIRLSRFPKMEGDPNTVIPVFDMAGGSINPLMMQIPPSPYSKPLEEVIAIQRIPKRKTDSPLPTTPQNAYFATSAQEEAAASVTRATATDEPEQSKDATQSIAQLASTSSSPTTEEKFTSTPIWTPTSQYTSSPVLTSSILASTTTSAASATSAASTTGPKQQVVEFLKPAGNTSPLAAFASMFMNMGR